MTVSFTESTLLDQLDILWKENRLSSAKQFLATLTTEEHYEMLIQQAYDNHMLQYADFLKRHAHKKFDSVQTTLWQAGVEFSNGNHFKAEALLRNRLFVESLDRDISASLKGKAAALLARIYGVLQRFEEVDTQHQLLSDLNQFTVLHKVYFLMDQIEREQAIALIENVPIEERTQSHHRLNLILSDLYLLEGNPQKSLDYLTNVLEKEPESFILRAERVTNFFLVDQFEKTLEELEWVTTRNPYHHLQPAFVILKAHTLYKLERIEELRHHVKKNQAYFKGHPYSALQTTETQKRVLLPLKQPVQKVNYCVPASLALILQSFGVEQQQETIARAVKEDQGTQLHHARDYMRSEGFDSYYFKGNIDLYKKLLDDGLPVMLSTLIEMNAHVQVLVGYDDRLQSLQIQDPNEVHPFNLSYDKVAEAYQLRGGLSLVFFPSTKSYVKDWIDLEQHTKLDELYRVTAEDNADVASYFANNPKDPAAAVIGLLSLSNEVESETSEKWLETVEEAFGKGHKDVKLIRSHFQFWKGEYHTVLEILSSKELSTNSNALFMKGISHLKVGQLDLAEKTLKKSLEENPYQAVAYSYLSRIALQQGYRQLAYRWSTVAKRMSPKDSFVRATDALVYFDNEVFDTAYSLFEELSKEDEKDGYALYEMARSRQFQGKKEEAEALYRQSLKADPTEPFAYLRLAELNEEDIDKRRSTLLEGLDQLPDSVPILLELGNLEAECDQHLKALTYYQRAAENESEDTDIQFSIAKSLLMQENEQKAFILLDELLQSEARHTVLEAARFVQSEVTDPVLTEKVLTLLESLLDTETGDALEDVAIVYIDFSTDARYFARVLDTFGRTRKRESTPELLILEAQLHERLDTTQIAREFYLQAGNYEIALNQLSKLAYLSGDENEARKLIKKLLLLAPFHEESLPALFDMYLEDGDFEAALKIANFVLPVSADLLSFDSILQAAAGENRLGELEAQFDGRKGRVRPEWWYAVKATIAQMQEDSEAAEHYFMQARSEPNAYHAHKLYGNFLVEESRYKEAITYATSMMEIYPDDPDFSGQLVSALVATKKVILLNRYLRKLPKHQLGNHSLTIAGNMANYFIYHAEQEVQGKLASLVAKGKQIFYAGNAIAYYEEACKLMPGDEAPAMQLAEFYLNSHQPDEAVKVLKSYANLEGSGAERMILYAYAQWMEQKPSSQTLNALTSRISRVVERSPEDLDLYDWWAQSLALSEDYKGAIDVLDRGLAIQQYHVEFHSMKWKSIEHIYQENAAPHLKNYSETLPEIVKAHEEFSITRAASFGDLSEGKLAKEILETFSKESVMYTASRFELARAEVLLGNRNEARKLLRRTLATDDGTLAMMAQEDSLLADLL